MKEWSRQISELNQDDFTLVHTATTLSSSALPLNTCDVSIATSVEDYAVSQQLCSLLEKLKSVDAVTSDSGAVSDYSENTDYKSHSLTSLDLEDSQQQCGCTIKGECETVYKLSLETTEMAIEDGTTVSASEKRDKNNDIGEEMHTATLSSERDEYSTAATETKKVLEDVAHLKEEQMTGNTPFAYNKQKEQKLEQCLVELPAGTGSKESDRKQLAVQPGKTGKKRSEDKRETISGEQSRIKRKTKQHYGHGYNNRRRSYSCYDNSRSRNSCHDNSKSNRGHQQTSSSSSKDPEVQKHSTFNHEEVATFLWNSESKV